MNTSRRARNWVILGAATAALAGAGAVARATSLPNGLYVERVGGTAGFGAGAAPADTKLTALPVYIDTFNAGGGLAIPVNTISFASASPPANTRILTDIADGTASSTTPTPYAVNIMGLSPNGRYLTVLGYTDAAGNAISTSGGTKSIGSVDLATGATSSQIGYLTSGVPRGAVTQDLSAYWTIGTSNNLQYITPAANPNNTATRVSVNGGSGRTVGIYGGQLFITSTATTGMAGTGPGLAAVGTGLPTSSATGNYIMTTNGNPEQFVMLDLNPSLSYSNATVNTGLDTTYIATDAGVEKWTFDGTSWTRAYILSGGLGATTGMLGVAYAGKDASGHPVLYGTTQGNVATVTSGFSNALLRLVDTGAGAAWSTVATSPANSLFRGVQFGTPASPGDANGDGAFGADDYTLLDRGFARYGTGAIPANGAGWRDGDFNYDGAVNSADYLILDTAYGQSHALSPGLLAQRQAAFGDAYVANLIANVPEPSSLAAALGMAVLPLCRRRRRGA